MSSNTRTCGDASSSASSVLKSFVVDASSAIRRRTLPASCGAMSTSGPSGRGSDSGSQPPHAMRMSGDTARLKCRTSAVLPTPASPPISASRPRPDAASATSRCNVPRDSERSSRSTLRLQRSSCGDRQLTTVPGHPPSSADTMCPRKGPDGHRASGGGRLEYAQRGAGDCPAPTTHVEGQPNATGDPLCLVRDELQPEAVRLRGLDDDTLRRP